MIKVVSAYEARTHLGELINLAYYNNIEVIIKRMGKPMVKIVKAYTAKGRGKSVTKKLLSFSGIWNNKDGTTIKKHVQMIRKKTQLLLNT